MTTTKMDDLEDFVSRLNPSTVARDRMGRVNLKPQDQVKKDRHHFKRNDRVHGHELTDNFLPIKFESERAARTEASRCLKCADAPCQIACPTSIDVRFFMQCMSTGNYYGAAKAILTENPCGSSCGSLCPTEELCVGSCNLQPLPIDIGGLQAFACNVFAAMRIPIYRAPVPVEWKTNEARRIAVVGSGPAGLSAATFLARLNYTVEIFERSAIEGGVTNLEVPEFRIPIKHSNHEVQMVKQLGVVIHTNTPIGRAHGLSLTDLHEKRGFDAVFVGVGLSKPKLDKIFVPHSPRVGVWNAKNFLQQAALSSKYQPTVSQTTLPVMTGNVLVIGAGDVSIDCARTAFRCGASRVCLIMRRSINDARAALSELSLAQKDCTDILPYSLPISLSFDPVTGNLVEVVLQQQVLQSDGVTFSNGPGKYVVPCTAVITAFGSNVDDDDNALAPLSLNSKGFVDINPSTMQTLVQPWLFAGGDVTGTSTLTVEAANDGKTAAFGIHQYLSSLSSSSSSSSASSSSSTSAHKKLKMASEEQESSSVVIHKNETRETSAVLATAPPMTTVIDSVDISVSICGIKFKNPFGLASAPPATSAAMIRRAFECGWGFAVTKTFCLDEDSVVNVSPRIVGTHAGTSGGYSNNPAYLNIELISEKSAKYWIRSCKQLKKEFPDHVVIASIMCSYDQNDWQQLTSMTIESGCDALELNLSCFPETDHQLLTNRGFMTLAQIEAYLVEHNALQYTKGGSNWGVVDGSQFGDLLVAAYDKTTQQLVYQRPNALIVNRAQPTQLVEFTHHSDRQKWIGLGQEGALPYGADIDSVEPSGQNFSILTTRDHSMLVSTLKVECSTKKKIGFEGTTKNGNVFDLADWQPRKYVNLPAGTIADKAAKLTTVLANAATDEVRSQAMDADSFGVQFPCLAANGLAHAVDFTPPFVALLRIPDATSRQLFLELYGMWLSDGSFDGRMQFARHKTAENKWLRATLKTLGFDFLESEQRSFPIAVRDKRVNEFIAAEYQLKYAKKFAWWTWRLSKDEKRAVLAGLQRANGERNNERSTFYTSSARLRDEIVRLGIEAGFSVRFDLKAKSAKSWRISFAENAKHSQPLLMAVNNDIRQVEYTGRTWCFSMPAGTVMVRRAYEKNGLVLKASKPVFTNNCPHGMGEKGMGLACGTDPEMVRNICKWVAAAAKGVPVFAKLTPNVTDIVVIARAAYEGGASGISTINTVSAMVDMKPDVDGNPTPSVGFTSKKTTYGGMSGGAIRPMALRDISAIARALPGFPILGIGGIESGDSAFEFIRCGASAVQVGSAIQSNDFGVIRDYISSLQTLLYLQTRRDLMREGWIGQSPPPSLFPSHPRKTFPNRHPSTTASTLPAHTSYERAGSLTVPVHDNQAGSSNSNNNSNSNEKESRIPSIKDMIGSSLNKITSHRMLDATEQVVALVNDEFCINCGRCFQTCNDNGYQAISMDATTHQVKVLDNCTGCGLCVAVCPAVGALAMHPRKTDYHIKRGTVPADYPLEIVADIPAKKI